MRDSTIPDSRIRVITCGFVSSSPLVSRMIWIIPHCNPSWSFIPPQSPLVARPNRFQDRLIEWRSFSLRSNSGTESNQKTL